MVEKADFSTALFTRSVSSSGRNDDSHRENGSGLRPLDHWSGSVSWGVAPGWYRVRLWRSYLLSGFESNRGAFAALDEDVRYAGEEEDGQDGGVECGGVVALLDEPPVVDDSGDGGDVDEAVETLPVFSAHGTEDEDR